MKQSVEPCKTRQPHGGSGASHASPMGETTLTPNYGAQFLHVDLLWEGESQNWEMWAKYHTKYTKSLDESKNLLSKPCSVQVLRQA